MEKKWLTGKKQEDLDFLTEVGSLALQQGLRHLQTAFTNFFSGRTKYPFFLEIAQRWQC